MTLRARNIYVFLHNNEDLKEGQFQNLDKNSSSCFPSSFFFVLHNVCGTEFDTRIVIYIKFPSFWWLLWCPMFNIIKARYQTVLFKVWAERQLIFISVRRLDCPSDNGIFKLEFFVPSYPEVEILSTPPPFDQYFSTTIDTPKITRNLHTCPSAFLLLYTLASSRK